MIFFGNWSPDSGFSSLTDPPPVVCHLHRRGGPAREHEAGEVVPAAGVRVELVAVVGLGAQAAHHHVAVVVERLHLDVQRVWREVAEEEEEEQLIKQLSEDAPDDQILKMASFIFS